MAPALETLEAAGEENESKYRSGRGTGLLEFQASPLSLTPRNQ